MNEGKAVLRWIAKLAIEKRHRRCRRRIVLSILVAHLPPTSLRRLESRQTLRCVFGRRISPSKRPLKTLPLTLPILPLQRIYHTTPKRKRKTPKRRVLSDSETESEENNAFRSNMKLRMNSRYDLFDIDHDDSE